MKKPLSAQSRQRFFYKRIYFSSYSMAAATHREINGDMYGKQISN